MSPLKEGGCQTEGTRDRRPNHKSKRTRQIQLSESARQTGKLKRSGFRDKKSSGTPERVMFDSWSYEWNPD